MNVAEEMNDVLGPGQQGQIALNDNTVETVVYKYQEAMEELLEGFHGLPPQMFGCIPKSSALAPVESTVHSLGCTNPSPWDFKGSVRSDVDVLAE
jgi:hypothetical protein